jgi:hypothetical protein
MDDRLQPGAEETLVTTFFMENLVLFSAYLLGYVTSLIFEIIGTNSMFVADNCILFGVASKSISNNKPTHAQITEKNHIICWRIKPLIYKAVIKNSSFFVLNRHASLLIY